MTEPADTPHHETSPHELAPRTIDAFLRDLAAKTPAPGGGAVAGLLGAIAGATAGMVLSYSLGRRALAEHEPALRAHAEAITRLRSVCLDLASEDAEAYERLNALQKLPEGDPARAGLASAALAAARVPLASLATACDLLRHLCDLTGITNRHLRSDLAVAAIAAEAAARASAWNVRINLPALSPEDAEAMRHEADELLRTARALAEQTERACA